MHKPAPVRPNVGTDRRFRITPLWLAFPGLAASPCAWKNIKRKQSTSRTLLPKIAQFAHRWMAQFPSTAPRVKARMMTK